MSPQRARLIWILLPLLLAVREPAYAEWTDRSPHQSGFVTANGVKLHYLDWGGTGEAILLLHGLGDTAHIFDDLAPRFTDRFRVLGLTRRGHGRSDKPDAGYDTATLVEDIHKFLAAMRIRRVVLVGHSLAGDELTRFATVHPESVIKLIYLDAAQDRADVVELLKQAPRDLSPTAADMESLDSFRRWVSRMSFWSEAWEANLRDMMVYSPDGKILKEAKPQNATRLLILGMKDSHPNYAKIAAPALNIAVVGVSIKASEFIRNLPDLARARASEHVDRVTHYQRQQVAKFRREILNGKIIEFIDTDHHCFIQRQDDVVREMRKFLAE